jgi:hypothetical protein
MFCHVRLAWIIFDCVSANCLEVSVSLVPFPLTLGIVKSRVSKPVSNRYLQQKSGETFLPRRSVSYIS